MKIVNAEKLIEYIQFLRPQYVTDATSIAIEVLLTEMNSWIKFNTEEVTDISDQWIPVTTRPLDDEEKAWALLELGYVPEHVLDCKLPDDGEDIIYSRNGHVGVDTNCIDDGYYLETNGDWEDIDAWMPMLDPYKKKSKKI